MDQTKYGKKTMINNGRLKEGLNLNMVSSRMKAKTKLTKNPIEVEKQLAGIIQGV